MQLIALITAQARLHSLAELLEGETFHLHPVAPRELGEQLAALARLQFSGAVLPHIAEQTEAMQFITRVSPTSQEAGALCTVTTTPAGNIGDYLLGRALAAAMWSVSWDARGARAVVIGEGAMCRAISRALSSLGVSHLTVIAKDRPTAEHSLPVVAVTTATEARAKNEASSQYLLEQADLLICLDPQYTLDSALFGPHLSLIDMTEDPLSAMRKTAIQLGVSTLSHLDIQAHHFALSIGHLLGQTVPVEPFLEVFHQELSE
jgi:shikimate 5-dehydrogenase